MKGMKALFSNEELTRIEENEDNGKRIISTTLRLEDLMEKDETVIELLEKIATSIEKVNETNLGERVLDIKLEYKNYKTNVRDSYDKRFKNGSKVEKDETQQYD